MEGPGDTPALFRRIYVFTPTDVEGRHANLAAAVVSLLCSAFAIVVVILSAIVWRDPRTRRHLNKISTKLLLWCVALSIPLGLAFALTNSSANRSNIHLCRFGMWTSIFFYNLLNWLQGCISINLMLALKVPGLFEKHNMARVYWAGGLFVAIAIASVPLIANRYSWSDELHSCWVRDAPGSLGVWQLSITEAPLIVVTVLMFVATVTVGVHLLREHKAGKRANQLINQLYEPAIDDGTAYGISDDNALPSRFEVREITVDPNHKLFDDNPSPGVKSSAGSHHSETPSDRSRSGRSAWRSPLTFSRQSPSPLSSSPPASPGSRPPSFLGHLKRKPMARIAAPPAMCAINEEQLSPRTVRVAKLPMSANFGKDPKAAEARELRYTLLRISVYPVLHLITAVLGPMGSLMLDGAEDSSRDHQLSLYYLSLIGTALIPLAYSCCAVFADVSLYHGLREWVQLRYNQETEDLELALGKNKHRWSEYENAGECRLSVSVQHVPGSHDLDKTDSGGGSVVVVEAAKHDFGAVPPSPIEDEIEILLDRGDHRHSSMGKIFPIKE